MILWMEVTRDEYELPVAVGRSAGELAMKIGVERNAIFSAIRKAKIRQEKQGHARCRYLKVVIDDEHDHGDT